MRGQQIIQFHVSFIVVTRTSNIPDDGKSGEAMFIRRVIKTTSICANRGFAITTKSFPGLDNLPGNSLEI